MILDKDQHCHSIGLLSVHACIALTDALLASVEPDEQMKREDHTSAVRDLRKWCSIKSVDSAGVKHLDWLLGRKNLFSYASARIELTDFERAKVKMDQYFAWAFHAFPAVAQLDGNFHE